MEIKATGLPETIEDYQVALNAAFAGGKAYGLAQRTWGPWILVETALPNNGDLVLVAFKGFAYPDTATWSSGKWCFGREYEDSQWDEVENPIVKWMKLPSVHDEYTAPQPPQRKPLTDEKVNQIWFEQNKTHGSIIWRFARAIEAAHGIKEKNT